MAKKKMEISQEELFTKIAAKTGGEVLGRADSIRYHIDTGSLAINFICSGNFIHGGIPAGKITEIYGPSSSGKSLVASNVLFGCQKLTGWPIILDCENATNADFMAKTSHLNLNKVLRYTPMTLEAAFLRIHTTVREIREVDPDGPIVVVYDSISVSPCERELKETNLPQGYKPSDWKKIVGRQEQPGERAKVCSRELRKLQPMLEKNNVTVMIINQTRERIGVLWGSPETTAGGGNSLPFYASCRLRSATRKKIENKRLNTFAGVNMHIKNVKNRTFRPFVESEGIQLFFDTGINPLTGLLSCLTESERVVGKAGNYTVLPAYLPEDKADYKFRSSKERNDIPLQVLLDCPKLIGATTTVEVQEYMSAFAAAIDNSNSDDFTEKVVAFDADGNPLDQEDPETTELED